MDAVLLQLQIEIGVGKATGTPVLEGNDLARLGREFAAELAAPRAILEGLSGPGEFLDRGDVLPAVVVSRAVSTMRRVEDAKAGSSRRRENLQHMWNTSVCFCDSLQTIPYLAPLGNEIVVGIDHEKGSQLLV